MASDSAYTKLLALYPKGNMPHKEQQMLFGGLVRQMESRISGDYPTHPGAIDNLTLIERGLKSPAMPPSAHESFRRTYWPRIRDAKFTFYSVDNFLKFHLPFAEEFVATTSIFRFEGPEDEPEFFGKHQGCVVFDGRSRGCAICELLALLDAHLPDDHTAKPLGLAIERQQHVRVSISGAFFEIRGTVRDGLVRSLVVEGHLHLLAWDLYRRPSASRDGTENSELASRVAVEMHDGARGDSAMDKKPDVELICLHGLGRPGVRHCEDASGCWEVAAMTAVVA
ncbi:hypothetical protein LTR36_006551 [Oleoguttula mirabilis]|uniref:Uncharacterized protein n=1 Tax=Oleoguttula mirabilis TaxID=1507867 RepID=A0AAV9JW55_9PEZI|nr:hypothetical protein LTR36_006551 [Oleoguttula mirabilis]